MTVVKLNTDNEQVAMLRAALKDAISGELEGVIIVCEYSNGVVTNDIAGLFDVHNRFNVMGMLEESRDAVKFIDTDTTEHDYD